MDCATVNSCKKKNQAAFSDILTRSSRQYQHLGRSFLIDEIMAVISFARTL